MSEQSLTLVLGGVRSGKSRHAEVLIEAQPSAWRYLATGQAIDDEMAERIALHQSRRPAGWITVEAPLDLAGALAEAPDGQPVLIDCLTIWLGNVLHAGRDPEAEADRLAAALARPRGPWIAVSNEVGLGIIPDNPLARAFADAAGRLNQAVAAAADHVVFMVAGQPVRVR
ncbi:MAG TPA: bifunctional adenosylcobinamide kinase/adenosylcobinamide-phosphate guanylyltransferase [Amaricoccus sp.]|nr:bifunctional adenosylcobinamide kinase/adenosylcobinamide-phosphate guanylyltransferase [Amaricoccus sp.]